MSELYPPGITDMVDLPYPLHDAIVRALLYLSWEELPNDERPPKRIWLDGDRLRDWFKAVEAKRKDQSSGNSSSEIEDPVENDAAKALLGG